MAKKIRVGTDIVHLPKFERSLNTGNFIQKIFHPKEIQYCENKPVQARLASYAARFAAKEAFSKALGTGLFVNGVTPRDIWIENEATGRPFICLAENILLLLNEVEYYDHDISLSHHEQNAIATVILY